MALVAVYSWQWWKRFIHAIPFVDEAELDDDDDPDRLLYDDVCWHYDLVHVHDGEEHPYEWISFRIVSSNKRDDSSCESIDALIDHKNGETFDHKYDLMQDPQDVHKEIDQALNH